MMNNWKKTVTIYKKIKNQSQCSLIAADALKNKK